MSNIEPFGYFKCEFGVWVDCSQNDEGAIPLYESPPAPDHIPAVTKMVMVTDLEMLDMYCEPNSDKEMFEFGRAVQKRFMEKNGLSHDQ